MENKVKGKSIAEMIKYWSEKKPQNKILINSSKSDIYTYRQFLDFINTLNKELKVLINKHARIAVLMSAGCNCALVSMALTKCFTVLPLNPDCSTKEFNDYFKRFKVDAIFIDKNLDKKIIQIAKDNNKTILQFQGIKNNKINFKALRIGSIINSLKENKNITFILPTSGTTAKPKIVLLSKLNVFYSAKNICTSLKLSPRDVCLSPMPLFHVHGLMILVSGIFSGSSVVSTPKYENEHFFASLYKFKPSWYTASAGIQENILIRAKKEIDRIKKVNLRFIRSSSAPLSPQTTKELESLFEAPVAESYGMTEATLQITSQPLAPETKTLGSCGKVVGVDLKIVDEDDNFLGLNEVGEILLRGKSVIKKYENNDIGNKKLFWNGWLRTGDLGYLDKNDFLFIKGRKKEMINKGGEKISPREVEEALMSHEVIDMSVAFAMPHKTLGEAVVVAVVIKRGSCLSEAELRDYLKGKIAKYKTPSKFYFVNNIPRTAIGKPIRIGLYEKLRQLNTKKNKARNQLDLLFVDIWQKVLNVKVDIKDNYFEIGGDSIQFQEIISETAKQNIKINYIDIQNYPTIKQLSDFIIKNEKGI